MLGNVKITSHHHIWHVLLDITGEQLPSGLADLHRVPEVVYTTYNMGTWDLPGMYAHILRPAALRLGDRYQANPLCPCYNYYICTIMNEFIYINFYFINMRIIGEENSFAL